MITAIEFITRQLAATGWAPINQMLAERLCPGIDNAWRDLGRAESNPVPTAARFPHCQLYRVNVEGIGIVPVLAASDALLAERVQFITGGKVAIAEPAPSKAIWPTKATEPVDPVANSDLATKEEARSCSTCDNLTAGHVCQLAYRRKLPGAPVGYQPGINTLRRCISYVPKFGTMDDRTGREIWPELLQENRQIKVGIPVTAGALEKAQALLADLLKNGPCNAAEILAAAEGDSIGERTIQRAADALGIEKSKLGFGQGWIWKLPEATV